jgi:hypothetical protein
MGLECTILDGGNVHYQLPSQIPMAAAFFQRAPRPAAVALHVNPVLLTGGQWSPWREFLENNTAGRPSLLAISPRRGGICPVLCNDGAHLRRIERRPAGLLTLGRRMDVAAVAWSPTCLPKVRVCGQDGPAWIGIPTFKRRDGGPDEPDKTNKLKGQDTTHEKTNGHKESIKQCGQLFPMGNLPLLSMSPCMQPCIVVR